MRGGLAEIYTAMGEKDEAFRWLEVAYESRQTWMPWLRHLPTLMLLRSDPRFQVLVQRMNLQEYQIDRILQTTSYYRFPEQLGQEGRSSVLKKIQQEQ